MALVLKYRIPSMVESWVNVEAGRLMSYGTKSADFFAYRRAATYVDKILRMPEHW